MYSQSGLSFEAIRASGSYSGAQRLSLRSVSSSMWMNFGSVFIARSSSSDATPEDW